MTTISGSPIKSIKSNSISEQIKIDCSKLEETAKYIINLKKTVFDCLGNDCYWILYNYDNVRIGKEGCNLLKKLDSQEKIKRLKEFRCFSPKGEFHLWRYYDQFRWRLRWEKEEDKDNFNSQGKKDCFDDEKDEIPPSKFNPACFSLDEVKTGIVNIYEEIHYRWSFEKEPQSPKNIKLIPDESINPPESLPKMFKVYNYFDYDDNGLIYFYDARLVNFVNEENQKGEF